MRAEFDHRRELLFLRARRLRRAIAMTVPDMTTAVRLVDRVDAATDTLMGCRPDLRDPGRVMDRAAQMLDTIEVRLDTVAPTRLLPEILP